MILDNMTSPSVFLGHSVIVNDHQLLSALGKDVFAECIFMPSVQILIKGCFPSVLVYREGHSAKLIFVKCLTFRYR